jgi:hypothetical protein
MKKSLSVAAVLVLTLSGCATDRAVPATSLRLNPKTGEVQVNSPKEIDMRGVKVRVDGPRVDFTLESYSSHNSPDVIAAQAEANARAAAANAQTADKILQGLKTIESIASELRPTP